MNKFRMKNLITAIMSLLQAVIVAIVQPSRSESTE